MQVFPANLSSAAPPPALPAKGSWTEEEDGILLAYITKHGAGKWDEVARKSGLRRGGKSCRLRWKNQLHPRLKKEPFTVQEKEYALHLHKHYGSKWTLIASHFPGRTDNAVKNICNSLMKSRKQRPTAGTKNIVHEYPAAAPPSPPPHLLPPPPASDELPSIQHMSPESTTNDTDVDFWNSMIQGYLNGSEEDDQWPSVEEDLCSEPLRQSVDSNRTFAADAELHDVDFWISLMQDSNGPEPLDQFINSDSSADGNSVHDSNMTSAADNSYSSAELHEDDVNFWNSLMQDSNGPEPLGQFIGSDSSADGNSVHDSNMTSAAGAELHDDDMNFWNSLMQDSNGPEPLGQFIDSDSFADGNPVHDSNMSFAAGEELHDDDVSFWNSLMQDSNGPGPLGQFIDSDSFADSNPVHDSNMTSAAGAELHDVDFWNSLMQDSNGPEPLCQFIDSDSSADGNSVHDSNMTSAAGAELQDVDFGNSLMQDSNSPEPLDQFIDSDSFVDDVNDMIPREAVAAASTADWFPYNMNYEIVQQNSMTDWPGCGFDGGELLMVDDDQCHVGLTFETVFN